MSKYRKFIAAFAGFLAIVASVLADGVIVADEYETIASAGLAAFFVLRLKNIPSA